MTAPISQNPPPSLFTYRPLSKYDLENLLGEQLYFGPPKNFNDPFDCAFAPALATHTTEEWDAERLRDMGDPPHPDRTHLVDVSAKQYGSNLTNGYRQALAASIKKFRETAGVCCFSERNVNLLLWAHYAAQYRGMCLEFSTDHEIFQHATKVRYVPSIPEIPVIGMQSDVPGEVTRTLFCSKSDDWSYEQEWRVLCQNVCGIRYPTDLLRAVYFGPLTTDHDRRSVLAILRLQNSKARMFTGRLSKTKFKMEFEPWK